MPESDSPIRVRLDPDIRERLDRFQTRTRRNLTQSVNVLLDAGLSMAELPGNIERLTADPEGSTS